LKVVSKLPAQTGLSPVMVSAQEPSKGLAPGGLAFAAAHVTINRPTTKPNLLMKQLPFSIPSVRAAEIRNATDAAGVNPTSNIGLATSVLRNFA
jgi:hypothetical protein